MDERLNHLNLILEAPEKVSVAYTMSVLASRCLGAIEEEFKKPPEEQKSPDLEKAEIDKTQADAEKADADADANDPTLDPEFKKEFYLSSFDYKGKKIVLKKLGMGVSAPVSAYVDGKRAELFMSQKQAEREIKKLIDNGFVKTPKPEATVESLRAFGMNGGIVEHADGSHSAMKFSDIQDALEIYHRLNKEHRVAFEERLRKSQKDAADMIGFFQERLKRNLV
jgi:predicted transcriptional regulator